MGLASVSEIRQDPGLTSVVNARPIRGQRFWAEIGRSLQVAQEPHHEASRSWFVRAAQGKSVVSVMP